MDHSVKAMTSAHRKVALLSRVFERRRFENLELEELYQRYIFKLQQSSIVAVLALLTCLSTAMATVDFVFAGQATVRAVFCTFQAITLFALFLVTQFSRQSLRDGHLRSLCYVIVAFCGLYCVLELPVDVQARVPWTRGFWDSNKAAAEGVWPIVLVVFLAYALLPIRTRCAATFGTVLVVAHVAVSATMAEQFQPVKWNQVNALFHSIPPAGIDYLLCVCMRIRSARFQS